MAVLTIIDVGGDADELLRYGREHMAPTMRRLAPQHGGIAHFTIRTDKGIRAINVWETEAGSDAVFQEPDVQAVLKGMPGERIGREVHQVEEFEIPALASA